jgi:hypothetical protein
MTILGVINKQPSEVLDFDISYAPVLQGRNDTLSSATGFSTPPGITIVSATVNASSHVTQTKISGGTDGLTYKVTIQTSTTGGLLYEDEVTVIVEEV